MARVILDKVCKKMGVNRRQLAIRAKKDPKNITRVFHPDYDPRISELEPYAKALGKKVRDLIEG